MSDKDVETQRVHPALGSPSLSNDVDDAVHIQADLLARRLSARQVQMIAIGGTIVSLPFCENLSHF